MKMQLHIFIRKVKVISPHFCGVYDSASPENFFLPLESGHTIKVLPTRGSVRPIKKRVLKCSMVTKRGPPCSSLLCFKYHSRSLFVNPRLIIWNGPAISRYSDLAPSISAGKGIERGREKKKRDTQGQRMRKTERTQEGRSSNEREIWQEHPELLNLPRANKSWESF